jgi:phosphohistidine swiveling domain-containing protein
MEKIIYKKLFTRPISLLSMEIWFWGENRGIKEITDGKFYFNPLFIYKEGQGTDVYYDFNNQRTDVELMIKYFVKHPKKFESRAKKYLSDCGKIIKLVDSYNPKDLKKLYQMTLSVQSMLTLSVVLGRQYKKRSEPIFALAYNLRKRTDQTVYRASEKILSSFKRLKPQLKSSIDVLTFNEIYKKRLSEKIIKERKNGFIYFEGSVYAGVSLVDFQKLKKIVIEDEKIYKTGVKEIGGTAAQKGLARGRVKLVFNLGQLSKVKNGDILVTPMTTPDYLPALKRAAAFITDEGGLTCHAAIVARELEIPCVIGTKIATKVLHDGDLVEVNANHAVIKILKQ